MCIALLTLLDNQTEPALRESLPAVPASPPSSLVSLQHACLEFICSRPQDFPHILSRLPKDVEEKLLNYIATQHSSRSFDIMKNFLLAEDFILDTIITDEAGRAFWKRYFGYKASPLRLR